MIKKIVIKGAKEHNLKNVSVEIPKDQFVVITGLSGSGKSSLAFDTIYAEGQRRYVESLSAYARQFLDKMKKPNVDLIEGLSPAIAIEQKNTSKNPRSTVATVTEIYDYMRVLYARAGVPYSPFTGKPITSQTITQIVDLIKKLPKKSTIYIYAPVVRGRKGEYRKDILSYKRRGFRKIKIDEVLYDIDKAPELDKKLKHDISVLIDRIVLNSNLGNRLAESIETAVNLSNGLVFVEYEDETLPQKFRKIEKLIYSTKFACPESGFTIEEIEPRLFSFNSPYGACAECEGIGIKLNVDPNLVVPDEKKSIADGAIEPWAKSTTLYYAQTLASIAKHYGFSLDEKWKKLPKKFKDVILFGSDEEEIKFVYDDGYEKYSHKKTFEGVINNLERRFLESDSEWKREAIAEYQSDSACEGCDGNRLKEEALCIKINKENYFIVGHNRLIWNNHLDILEVIKRTKNSGEFKTCLFLNYGQKGYYFNKLVEFAQSIPDVVLIEEFMTLPEFEAFYVKCAALVINSKRQLAGNNIRKAFEHGTKVYLDPDNSFYDYFKNNNFIIYNLYYNTLYYNIV